MKLLVQTADLTRKGQLDLESGAERQSTVADLLAVLKANFKLSEGHDYYIRSERAQRALDPKMTLQEAGVVDGDTIEVVPILVAGR
jgi:hypothetical protein